MLYMGFLCKNLVPLVQSFILFIFWQKKKKKILKGRRIRKKFVSVFRSFVFITNALMELFGGYITRLLENFWKSYWRLGETVMLVLAQVSSTFPSIIINQRQKHFKYGEVFFFPVSVLCNCPRAIFLKSRLCFCFWISRLYEC